MVDWGLTCQQKQMHINKDSICKNIKKVDHNYKVGDKFIIVINDAYKYVMPYNRPFGIAQFWSDGTATLQCGAINIRHNICHINPYIFDTDIEDIKC